MSAGSQCVCVCVFLFLDEGKNNTGERTALRVDVCLVWERRKHYFEGCFHT